MATALMSVTTRMTQAARPTVGGMLPRHDVGLQGESVMVASSGDLHTQPLSSEVLVWPRVLEKAPGELLSSVGLMSWGCLAFPFLLPLRFLAFVTLLRQMVFNAQAILF